MTQRNRLAIQLIAFILLMIPIQLFAGPPEYINPEFPPPPQNTTQSIPIVQTVSIRDVTGDVVTTASGQVTLDKVSGPGNVLGNLHIALVNGVATFDSVTFDTPGTYTLKVTYDLVTSDFTYQPINVLSPAPERLHEVQGPPGGVTEDFPFTIVVRVEDVLGNVTPDSTGTITLSKISGPGNIVGPTTAILAGGYATFDAVSLDIVGAYSLKATYDQVTQDLVFSTINVTGDGSGFTGTEHLHVQEGALGTVTADQTLFTLTVEARDVLNMLTNDSTTQVTLSVVTGAGTLYGNLQKTFTNGVVTFDNLFINGPAGTYGIRVSADVVTQDVISDAFTVTHDRPYITEVSLLNGTSVGGTHYVVVPTQLWGSHQGPTVFINSGQSSGYATGDAPAISGAPTWSSGESPLNGSNHSFGAILAQFTTSDLANFQSNLVTNANTTIFGAANGPINASLLDLAAGNITNDRVISIRVDMKHLTPHLIAIMGGTDAQVSYDETGSGTVYITMKTTSTTNAAGQFFQSLAGFQIFTDPAFGNDALGAVVQTDAWAGDVFPLLPGVDANAAVGGNGGTAGTFTAKCGTTVNGPTGQTRNVQIFMPHTSIVPFFGAGATFDYAAAFVNTGNVTASVTNNHYNFGEFGTRIDFQYTFASPKDVAFSMMVPPSGYESIGTHVAPPTSVSTDFPFQIVVKAVSTDGSVTADTLDKVFLSLASGNPLFMHGPVTADFVGGYATFDGVSFDTVGSYQLKVTSDNVTQDLVFATTSVTSPALAPEHMTMVQAPPANVTANNTFTVIVNIQDVNSQVTPDTVGTAYIRTWTGPAGIVTNGDTTTVQAQFSGGFATFDNISYDAAGTYTIAVTFDQVTSDLISPSFNVNAAGGPAGPPEHLAFDLPPPGNITEDTPFSIRVKIQDANGVTTQDTTGLVHIGVATGPGGIVTNGNSMVVQATFIGGMATFDAVSLDLAGAYTLRVTSDLVTQDLISAVVNVSGAGGPAGPAEHLTIVQQPPGSVTIDTPFQVIVNIQDANGQVTPDTVGTTHISVFSGPGNLVTSASVLSTPFIGGFATFDGVSLDTAGAYTLKVTSDLVTQDVTTAVVNVTGPTAGAPEHLAFDLAPPSNITEDTAFMVRVKIQDANGVTTQDTTGLVHIGVATGPGGIVTNGNSMVVQATFIGGMATFDAVSLDLAGAYTLRVTSDLVTQDLISAVVNVSGAGGPGGPPEHMTIVQQPPGSTTIDHPFQVIVNIMDANGQVTPDTVGTAHIAVFTGPGGIVTNGNASALVATFSGGFATFDGVSLDAVGAYTLKITSDLVTQDVTTAVVNVNAAPVNIGPLYLSLEDGPPAQVTLDHPLRYIVSVRNENNAVTPDAVGTGSLLLQSGPGTIIGSTNVTIDNGVITFDNIMFSQPGIYTVKVSYDYATSDLVFTPLNVYNHWPVSIAFEVTPPGSASVLEPFDMTVSVRDQIGNITADTSGQMHLSISTGPGGAAINGPITADIVMGYATFDGVSLDTIGSYNLRVSFDQVTADLISAAISINPDAGPETLVGVLTPPGSITVDVPFSVITKVISYDGSVTADTTGTAYLNVISGPAGAYQGPVTAAFVGGYASFDGVSFDQAGTFQLSVSFDQVTADLIFGNTIVTIDLTPQGPHHLYIVQQPPTTILNNTPFSIGAEIRDINNQVTTDSVGTAWLSIASGSGNLAGPMSVPFVNGLASFDGVSLDVAGAFTLRVTTDLVTTDVVSQTINVTFPPAAPDHMLIVHQPPSVVTTGSTFRVVASVIDTYGGVTADTVGQATISLATGSGTVTGPLTVSFVGGYATFDGLSVAGSGPHSLRVSYDQVTVDVTTNVFNVMALPVTLDFVQYPPASVSADHGFPVILRLLDSNGYLVSQDSSTIVSATSDGIYLGPTTADVVSGYVTFNNIRQILAGSHTLTFSMHWTTNDLTASWTTTADASRIVPLLPGQTLVAGLNPTIAQSATITTDVTETLPFTVQVMVTDNYHNLASSYGGTLKSLGIGPSIATLPSTAGARNITITSGQGSATLRGITTDRTFVTADLTNQAGFTSHDDTAFRVLRGLRIVSLCYDDLDRNGATDSVIVSFDGSVDDTTITTDQVASVPYVLGWYLDNNSVSWDRPSAWNTYGTFSDNRIELRFENPQSDGTTTKDLTYFQSSGLIKSTWGSYLLDFVTADNANVDRNNKQDSVVTSDTPNYAHNGTYLTSVTVDFSGAIPADLLDQNRWFVVAEDGTVLTVVGLNVEGNTMHVSLDGTLGNVGVPNVGFINFDPNAVVTGLNALPGGTAAAPKIDLVWNAISDPTLEKYLVFRANGPSGPWKVIGETTLTATSDTTIAQSTTYYYHLRALLSGGQITLPSNTVFSIVDGSPPTATASATPTSGTAPLTVTFTGSGEDAPPGFIVGYEWDFNVDDAILIDSTASSPTFTYEVAGQYTARLRVRDNNNNIGTAEVTITVTAPSSGPTANATLNVTAGPAPLTVTFSDTSTQGTSPIVLWQWDFDGDGEFDFSDVDSGTTTHVYRVPNQTYSNVKLQVQDENGLSSAKTFSISVGAATNPPQVTLDAAQATGPDGTPISPNGALPYCVTLDATTYDGAGGNIVKWEWDFDGNGIIDQITTRDDGVVTHCYTVPGSYSPKVWVTDTDGLLASSSTFIQVQTPTNANIFLIEPVTLDKVGGDQIPLVATTVPNSLTSTVVFESSTNGSTWTQVGQTQNGVKFEYVQSLSLSGFSNGPIYLRARCTDVNGGSDTSPVVKVIKVNEKAAKIIEKIVNGRTRKEVSFDATVAQRIKSSIGAAIRIPLGALSDDAINTGGLRVAIAEKGNSGAGYAVITGLPSGASNLGRTIGFDINMGNGGKINKPGKPIVLNIPYPDENDDGIVDGTNIQETKLQIWWYDEVQLKWRRTVSNNIDTANNIITVKTAHLTDFGMFSTVVTSALGGGAGVPGGSVAGAGLCLFGEATVAEWIFWSLALATLLFLLIRRIHRRNRHGNTGL